VNGRVKTIPLSRIQNFEKHKSYLCHGVDRILAQRGLNNTACIFDAQLPLQSAAKCNYERKKCLWDVVPGTCINSQDTHRVRRG